MENRGACLDSRTFGKSRAILREDGRGFGEMRRLKRSCALPGVAMVRRVLRKKEKKYIQEVVIPVVHTGKVEI